MEKIYCSLCNKEFETFTRVVQTYRDYELCEEKRTYPINAHLLSGYICDDCYKQLPEIVRNLIVEAGNKYISELAKRQSKAKEKYLAELILLENENAKVAEIKKMVETCPLSELPEDIVDEIISLNGTYPYSNGGDYLETAIKMDAERLAYEKNTRTFVYNSYHFTPVKQLKSEELSLKAASAHIYSDRELGMMDYEEQKHAWNYNAFYEASGGSSMDLFRCEENGKLYLPGEHELFGYK